MDRSSNDLALVRRLRVDVLQVLTKAVGEAKRCALVGYPNHNNAGDSAIWLGERLALRTIGVPIAYVCDDESYNPDDLRRACGRDDPILLHGGGNFGDIWPEQQGFRERVLRDFPDRRVVQLAQTIDFSSGATLARSRRLVQERDHELLVLCRDRESLQVATDGLGVRAQMCPDPALLLVAPPQPAPQFDITVNARSDHESVGGLEVPQGATTNVVDWFDVSGSRGLALRRVTVRTRILARTAASQTHGQGHLARAVRRVPTWGADQMATRRVQHAYALLSSGRVVITDRLHGHILSTLLGIPHVCLDTGTRKIGRFHGEFTTESSTTWLARSPKMAQAIASQILERIREVD